MSADPAPASTPRRDGLLVAATALVLYTLLAQQTWYKLDGQVTLWRVLRGNEPHPRHLLADQMVSAFATLTRPLGVSLYDAAVLLAALSTAAAVLVAHAAARAFGLPRGRAALAAALVGMAPGPVFYATIVEFHAPFFCLAALAFLAATRLGGTGHPGWGVTTGLLGTLAFLTHASGAILPACLLPWAVAIGWPRPGRSRLLLAAGLAVAVHAAGVVMVPALLRARGLLPAPPPGDAALAGLNYWARHFDWLTPGELRFLATTLWREWLLPFLPASCLMLWELRRGGLRLGVLAVVVAAVPYLGSSFLLMRHEDEFGAYALPLLLPAALLAARAVPGRLLVAGLLTGLAVGAVTVHRHDDWPYGREFARDLAELRRDGPLLLIVHRGESEEECRLRNECDAALMHADNRERSEFFDIKEEVVLVPPATFDLVVADYRQRGYRVLLTERAEAFLRGQAAGQALRVHLDARYERRPAGGSTLRGSLLTLRP